MKKLNTIGKSKKKIDALSLATGSAKFTDDFEIKNSLFVSFLYSPHAHAEIKSIDDKDAKLMEGVIDVLHYQNVKKQKLHTTAGQGYPEPSPYDTVMFDKKMRFVGDRVAVVIAESKKIADDAVKKIKVEYDILEAVFDSEKALEKNAPRIHGEDRYMPIPVKYEPERNLAAEVEIGFGDMAKGEKEADFIIEKKYSTHYASHAAIEPHSVASFFDEMGRLVIVTSTQVPFHVRRIVSKVLDYPLSKIRIIKPRIGGGFGGKQEVFLEPISALITIKYKRPVKIILSREEVFESSRTRHPMKVKLKTAVKNSGEITALSLEALLNTGAYGSHALTIVSNAGSKVLPFFNKVKNIHFLGQSAYTNLPIGGAYRGYGATQGYFALNQQIDIITRKLDLDILEYIKKNHIRTGETSEVFKALGEGTEGVTQVIHSCEMDQCIDKGAKAIDWYKKRDKRIEPKKDKVRGVGIGFSMQGSGIPLIDMGSASMKMNDDGSFNLYIGATDIGTGSDTILAQIVAEVLGIELDKVIVLSSDTDLTPFDVGAYASSTTYVSGTAVKKCADKIKDQILKVASQMLESDIENLAVGNTKVTDTKNNKSVSLAEVGEYSLYTKDQFQIQASASYVPKLSPPPFIAQFAEVEIDKKTGKIRIVKFVSAVDCGVALNPKLAEGQIEGAAVNGICYALTEEYKFSKTGKLTNKTFSDYKIWTANDMPEMETIIAESDEETGPFGAKSVGEIGINGPLPAIANAIYDAVGVRLYHAPFTAEKIYEEINRIK
ncbi:MAG: molybdopterin cofactor-binding domain-containing protein [Candidatus Marinimicrobia bacterium]|nr:molybdopterin cofactor-binding domain-containing protein [Candidatus Neomarinimicrobiota bacterium]